MGAAIDSRRQSLVNRQGPAATVETVPLGRLHSGESRLLFPAFGGKRGFRVAVIVGDAQPFSTSHFSFPRSLREQITERNITWSLRDSLSNKS